MEIPDLALHRNGGILLKIVAEVDLPGKLLKIFLCDPHAGIVKVTAEQQDVNLIFIQTIDLAADQLVAEVDDRQRVQLGMIRKFRENQLVVGKDFLQTEHSIRETLVEFTVEFPKAELKGKTV